MMTLFVSLSLPPIVIAVLLDRVHRIYSPSSAGDSLIGVRLLRPAREAPSSESRGP